MATKKSKKKSTGDGAVHCAPYPMSAEDKKRQAEYAIEDDARTLQRAADIRADKPRLAKVKAWAKQRANELSNITSITD